MANRLATILGLVNDSHRYRFDQACRVKAIEEAARLGLLDIPDCLLSISRDTCMQGPRSVISRLDALTWVDVAKPFNHVSWWVD